MSEELQQLLLKAAYAGRKYHLAIQSQVDSISGGEHDTPGNEGLVDRYWDEWRQYTEQALALHAKEQS